MILADSDVLIDALRGVEGRVAQIARMIAARELCTSAITAFELRSGAKTAARSLAVEALLDPLPILQFDNAAAAAAAEARQNLESQGQTIGTADYLISGICLSQALPLMTRNLKHFSRVPGLLLVET